MMEVIPKATYPAMSSPLISSFWNSQILRGIWKSPQETLQNRLLGKMGVSLQKFTSQASGETQSRRTLSLPDNSDSSCHLPVPEDFIKSSGFPRRAAGHHLTQARAARCSLCLCSRTCTSPRGQHPESGPEVSRSLWGLPAAFVINKAAY